MKNVSGTDPCVRGAHVVYVRAAEYIYIYVYNIHTYTYIISFYTFISIFLSSLTIYSFPLVHMYAISKDDQNVSSNIKPDHHRMPFS